MCPAAQEAAPIISRSGRFVTNCRTTAPRPSPACSREGRSGARRSQGPIWCSALPGADLVLGVPRGRSGARRSQGPSWCSAFPGADLVLGAPGTCRLHAHRGRWFGPTHHNVADGRWLTGHLRGRIMATRSHTPCRLPERVPAAAQQLVQRLPPVQIGEIARALLRTGRYGPEGKPGRF
jgi:hypothetical protein